MRGVTLLIVLAGLATASCGDDAGSDRLDEAGSIRYLRSGGLAPIAEDLRIQPDGRATLSIDNPYQGEKGTSRFRVPEPEIEAIRAALEEADFADLPEEAEITCADCYQHVITYGVHTVNRAETSIPAELEPVLDRLSDIVAEHRPQGARIDPGG